MPAVAETSPTDAAPGAARTDAPAPKASKLDHALALARRGWPVFPLQENGKQPLPGSRGHLEATTDPDEIRARWTDALTGAALPYNIGVRPVAGEFSVVDLDTGHGVDGPANYSALGGVVDGFIVQTPSGGAHVYLAGPDIGTSAGRIGPGIDTRGSDGYIVAPGSTIDGKAYEVVADGPMLPVPAFVLERVPARSERPATATTYAVENDQPRNVARFAEACRRAPAATAGVWHDASRDLACEAVRCAVSVEKAIEVLLVEFVPRGFGFDEEGRDVRWPADVAASYAWALGEGEQGVHSVDAQLLAFHGVSIAPPPPDAATTPAAVGASGTRIRGLSPVECGQIKPAPYLIKGLLARGQVGLVAALPASGKSCFVPLLAYRLAQGETVFGRRTRPGRVAYFGLEDENGMTGRIEAHRLRYGDAPGFRLYVGVGNLLTSDADRAEIVRIIRADRPALVILDTVRAGWRGLSENDADAMGGVVEFARALAQEVDGQPGPCVILVHHTTKAGGHTASGSGVLEADVDVSLFLAKDEETNVVTVTMGKNRNGEAFGQELCFTFESVRIGTDEDGDPITRPVAIEVDPRTVKRTKALSPTQRKALTILEELVAAGGPEVQETANDMTWAGVAFGGSHNVPRTTWQAACELHGLSTASKPGDRGNVFRKALRELMGLKVIVQLGDQIYLLKQET